MQHSGAAHDAAGYNVGSLSARVKMALRALATGGITQNDAAAIGGVTPAYLSIVKYSPLGQAYMESMEAKLDDSTVDMTALMTRLAREAAGRMEQLMKFSANESIVFKASQDLLDRSPTTSKTQKIQVDSFSINSRDAKGIAEAMVQAAQLRNQFSEAATGDFIRVDLEPKQLVETT